jgi:phage nucleotide-binding protein
MLNIHNTSDPSTKPSLVMLVYGEGGVGKSTFAATAPKPLMADCEGGSKYFGLRGLKLDVAQIEKWSDMKDFLEHAKKNGYETIVIDPIGELMGKLKRFMIAQADRKLVQSDGTPSMAGWGWLKETMRAYLKAVRDSGMHVLLIAHVDPIKDEDRIILWPLLETKLREELVNMMDVVGYMTIVRDDSGSKRAIFVDPDTGKFKAKDRTGQLGKVIEPDFTKIIAACQGTASYAWMKQGATKPESNKATTAPKAEDTPVPTEESENAKKMREAREAAVAKVDGQTSTQ